MKRFIILFLLIIILSFFDQAKADGKIIFIQNQQTETINGVEYDVERYIGRPDGRTIVQQLKQLNVTAFPEDKINIFPNPAMGIGSAIKIIRATPIKISDGNEKIELRTWKSKVEEVLDEKNIEIGKDDRLNVDKNDTIEKNMTIKITRVQITEVSEKETIAYQKTFVDDPNIDKGITKILEKGKNGTRIKTFRVRRENGKEVERTLIKIEITTEPTAEKIVKGTKVVVYGTGQATWYALKSGMTAAHNSLPHGTKVHVVNLSNDKSVDVTINDHGIQGSAIIDLTKEAFAKIAPISAGRVNVRVEKYYGE